VVEKVVHCPVPEFPAPEEDILMADCAKVFPGATEGEVACFPAHSVYILDRWVSAIERWADEVTSCPGVVVGDSNVVEELGKLP